MLCGIREGTKKRQEFTTDIDWFCCKLPPLFAVLSVGQAVFRLVRLPSVLRFAQVLKPEHQASLSFVPGG